MQYNNLPEKGKEEVREQVKLHYYEFYGEHLTEHLLKTALEEENYEVKLFISFEKIDKISHAMIAIEERNSEGFANEDEDNEKDEETGIDKGGASSDNENVAVPRKKSKN